MGDIKSINTDYQWLISNKKHIHNQYFKKQNRSEKYITNVTQKIGEFVLIIIFTPVCYIGVDLRCII